MKESVSVTAIFQIVILFILLFTGIMCLTINNSNAFGVKDEIINIIELSKGINLNSEQLSEDIVNLMEETSYRTSGKCDDDYIGYDRQGNRVNNGRNAAVCIKEVKATDGMDDYLKEKLGNKVATGDFINGSYYQIEVFYQLDIPIIKQVYNMKTKGETKIIYNS